MFDESIESWPSKHQFIFFFLWLFFFLTSSCLQKALNRDRLWSIIISLCTRCNFTILSNVQPMKCVRNYVSENESNSEVYYRSNISCFDFFIRKTFPLDSNSFLLNKLVNHSHTCSYVTSHFNESDFKFSVAVKASLCFIELFDIVNEWSVAGSMEHISSDYSICQWHKRRNKWQNVSLKNRFSWSCNSFKLHSFVSRHFQHA